jgi:hypothetical protein
MSGIIGHTMYAVLGGKAAVARNLPISGVIHRHYASYLCGAYLGCDIQTMPEAICVDTGKDVGYGTASIEKSPLTGGQIRPWRLEFGEKQFRPREIHQLFYGRSHLVFGWHGTSKIHAVPWDHLADYCAAVVSDAMALFGPGERQLAYLFGWMAHIVGDSLIKSVQPGITLELLDGKYTPRNRPIQDLVTYHDVGRNELGLRWRSLLADLARTPVEPIQLHYMRVGRPQGELAASFPNAWVPQHQPLLLAVLKENRRYQAIRNRRLVKLYALRKTGRGPECAEELSRQAGGLSYREMVGLAERAGFRQALWQMGEAVADLLGLVVERVPALAELSQADSPSWSTLTARWRRNR